MPEVTIASVPSLWDAFFGGEDDVEAERQKILESLAASLCCRVGVRAQKAMN